MNAKSWIEISPKSPFSLRNIPFGIISTRSDTRHRPAVVIGNSVLDLKKFAAAGGFKVSFVDYLD
jgi:fumarylacetoacetase